MAFITTGKVKSCGRFNKNGPESECSKDHCLTWEPAAESISRMVFSNRMSATGEYELENIKWHVVRLSGVWREFKCSLKLRSANVVYYKGTHVGSYYHHGRYNPGRVLACQSRPCQPSLSAATTFQLQMPTLCASHSTISCHLSLGFLTTPAICVLQEETLQGQRGSTLSLKNHQPI